MKKIFLVFFYTASTFLCFGQTISGKIINDANGESLEFASVGIIGTNFGVITNEKGFFRLDATGQSSNEQVRISMIGFESQTITLKNLVDQEIVVRLKEQSVQLKEVIVKSKKTKQKTIGTKSSSTFVVTGWPGYGTGGERGIRIDVKKPIFVEKVNFHIAYLGLDSVQIRLHIRKIENDTPTEELLTENILITAKSTGWYEIDLSKYNLSYSEDIAVTLEWVKAWGTIKDIRNTLKFSINYFKGTLYAKDASEAKWTTIKHGPGIYLTVQQ